MKANMLSVSVAQSQIPFYRTLIGCLGCFYLDIKFNRTISVSKLVYNLPITT